MKLKNLRMVRRLCKSGQKIAAISVLRNSNQPHMGIGDARDWVEREYPELRPPMPDPAVEAQRVIVEKLERLTPERRAAVLKAAAVFLKIQL